MACLPFVCLACSIIGVLRANADTISSIDGNKGAHISAMRMSVESDGTVHSTESLIRSSGNKHATITLAVDPEGAITRDSEASAGILQNDVVEDADSVEDTDGKIHGTESLIRSSGSKRSKVTFAVDPQGAIARDPEAPAGISRQDVVEDDESLEEDNEADTSDGGTQWGPRRRRSFGWMPRRRRSSGWTPRRRRSDTPSTTTTTTTYICSGALQCCKDACDAKYTDSARCYSNTGRLDGGCYGAALTHPRNCGTFDGRLEPCCRLQCTEQRGRYRGHHDYSLGGTVGLRSGGNTSGVASCQDGCRFFHGMPELSTGGTGGYYHEGCKATCYVKYGNPVNTQALGGGFPRGRSPLANMCDGTYRHRNNYYGGCAAMSHGHTRSDCLQHCENARYGGPGQRDACDDGCRFYYIAPN